jgi:preprotein translocase subunit SecG
METSGQSDCSPSEGIFKWWIIITLVTDVGILVFACLPIWPLFESVLGASLTDMLSFASALARGSGIGLVIFASNAFLLGRILYHRCKPKQLDQKVAVRAVMSNIGIKAWTVLIIVIDVAAIVFPILTMYMRRPDVSYAEMHEEVYPAAGASSGLTADTWLFVCVFLWTIIFASNTVLLIHNLFHKCEKDGQHPYLDQGEL